jgi:hypothetical protein
MVERVQEQQHPQEKPDREVVNNLLGGEPSDLNLVECARLRVRYRGFPGAREIQRDLDTVLQNWGLTETELFERTRLLHGRGQVYRLYQEDQRDWS